VSGPDLAAHGLIAPDYGGSCIDGVLPGVAASLGVELAGDLGPRGRAAADRFGLPIADRACVVLVDGLGLLQLRERAGHAPFLRSRLADVRALTAGFPSTTATSMGLFGTGRGAGRTALAGYTVRNPRTAGLGNLVSWEGVDEPEAWQREPSLTSAVHGAGIRVTSVGPALFRGSGLTRAALSGGRYVSADALGDRVDAALRALREPGLVYLYWGEVDKVGHQHGWRSAEWGDALAELDSELGRLARSLPRGTTLTVTADHGMVDVDRSAQRDVAASDALRSGVQLVAGEPRASHVHVEPGRAAEVAERWRAELAGLALVVEREEAVAAGWFGEVLDRVAPVLGDLVVVALDRASVVDSRTQTPHSVQLRGMHGSLTPGEMTVPLIVA
jgi:hypothetical protein